MKAPAVELRRIVRVVTCVIAVCAAASSGSLLFITGYLHRLTSQIDSNLNSVRAAEEIELQLLWHARSMNQATLMSAPERTAVASRAQADVLRWLGEAREYVGSEEETRILAALEQELDVYFARQEELGAAGLPALDRYIESIALFDGAYELAEDLLNINLAQASAATQEAQTWDRIATVIGVFVALALLVLTASLLVGAHRVVYQPLLALGGAIRRYAARDFTARAEEKGPTEIQAIARAFNEMAAELERQRTRQLVFVASVAHDLRNPLAAMKAAVESIAAGGGASGHAKLTAVVARQIDVLARMIADLLDSAHLESGRFTFTSGRQDARDLVLDAVALLSVTAPHHELVTKLPETPLMLNCDGAHVSQVINNLLINAVKYSPQGGRIETRAAAQANGISIEIADQGIGIPADELASIFEPFSRGSAVRGSSYGMGIGLSVARRIVEAHGGTVNVRSVLGAGTTFSIWLPSEAKFASNMAPADADERESASA